MRIRSFLVLFLVGLGLLATAPAAVASGELGLSRDGVHWSSNLSGSLFDPTMLWVPGDSETSTFYVRNQSDDPATLGISLLTGPVQELIQTGDLTVSAKVDNGAFHGVSTPGKHTLIHAVTAASGEVRKVTVKIDFDPTSLNQSQERRLDLRFDVTLTQSSASSPPGDGLPGTGNTIREWWLPLAGALICAGFFLVVLARRRPQKGAVE